MAQLPSVQRLKQTETDVAVLQVQYSNLNEKVDDMRTDLKELRVSIDKHMESIHKTISEFQAENKKQHEAVEKKVSALEKWRWMIMGASVLAGALGFHSIEKLIGM